MKSTLEYFVESQVFQGVSYECQGLEDGVVPGADRYSFGIVGLCFRNQKNSHVPVLDFSVLKQRKK